ncbi:uncharacterized protein LODBEIA_P23610 [Lodderomyces beijingensis]|uniref:Hydantoin racemase n=1 Tax=Lodderomyces beijingensis TaxID=1775926 RepID=A0ABP0ZL89_9ASCO
MAISLLIVNPNSSEKVTTNLKQVVTAPEGAELVFYTAPSAAPKEITGEQTSLESTRIVMADIKERKLDTQHDGFMVCCYSDHPLIQQLSQLTKKPVVGIMQATLIYALSSPFVKKSFVLTSTSAWEPLLDKGIADFAGAASFPSNKFQKTRGLNVSVLNLADDDEYGKIRSRVKEILEVEYKADNIDCVLLGCAGMAGLDKKLEADYPGVRFIDSVKIATHLLNGLVRFETTQ